MPNGPELALADRVLHYQRMLADSGGFGGTPEIYVDRYTRLRAILATGPPGSVIDFGCGLGDFYGYLPPGTEYLGIDLVPEFIALARQRFPAARFEVGDVLQPPCAPESFDYGVACTLFSFTACGEATRAIHAMRPIVRKALLVLDNNYGQRHEASAILGALAQYGIVHSMYAPSAQAALYVMQPLALRLP